MPDFQCPIDVPCTLQTCPLSCAQVPFLPTFAGNLTYAVLMGILLFAHLGLGIWYRTWGFLIGMISGLVLEIIGYAGRLMLHSDPFNFNNFLIYLIPLTIGPAFLTGSIYLCLSRIVIAYGPSLSRFRPRTYAIVFMCCDFVSLVLQGAGGGIAATATDRQAGNAGRWIMVAGLSGQVLSLMLFMVLWLDFAVKVSKTREEMREAKFANLRALFKFKAFQCALLLATILIFIRSIYRVVELQAGFAGPVAANQTAFMILEGPMIILSTFALAVLHPGRAFDGNWHAAAWSLRGRKTESGLTSGEDEMQKTEE